MKTVNMHEAKTHLSSLVNEEFIIARAGKPVARVIPITKPRRQMKYGWMTGTVPDDFDRLGEEEILDMFGLNDNSPDFIPLGDIAGER